MRRGFSIIEVLVVCAIMATFSVVLILNFKSSPKNRVARSQVADVIISDFRNAQALALAGSRFGGNTVCGFGVHYVNPTSYLIYAGVLNGGATRCIDTDHNYQAGIDLIVENKKIINVNMEMRSPFSDVFFEPPDPKTYINDKSALNTNPTTIQIQLVGQNNCSGQTCTDITINISGSIDVINN